MPVRGRSVTEGRSQLDLFTDRHRQVLAFTKALNQDPPPEEVFFFGGGGGNGKSLLLWFLEEHCCKRFSNWETQIGDPGPEERMSRLTGSTEAENPEVDFEPVPVVSHDFAAQPREFEQPKVAYDALAMLRRALSAEGFQFPVYTFASIWSLKQRNQLDDRRLKTLIPDEETGIISTIIDAITGTPWGSIASGVLNVLDDQLQEKWTLWQAQWGVDESMVTEIMEMDAERELPFELPYYFAQDLNTEMEAGDAPERVALLFDHYEAFSHQDSSESGPPGSGIPDQWVADLLSALDQSKGILTVLAGRDQPQWDGRSGGEQLSLRSFPVGHFTDTDAEDFLQRAEVERQGLRDKLKEFARVEPGKVHPLFVGLGVDTGLTYEITLKELAHIIVIPTGLLSSTSNASFRL